MTIQKYYYIRQYVFIISVLFLFSGCDIIDAIIGGDTVEPESVNDGWDYSSVTKYEVDYFIDKADYKTTYKETPPRVEYSIGRGQGGRFVSWSGEKLGWRVDFNCVPILGQTICGHMTLKRIYENGMVDALLGIEVEISQDKSWHSYVFGDVKQTYLVSYCYVPFSKTYTEDGAEVTEYYESGSAVSKINVNYKEENDIYNEELVGKQCDSQSWIKIKVYR